MTTTAPTLTLASVESSNVEAIGYNKENSILGVRFKNGGTYLYVGVLEKKYNDMRTAESVGSYLASEIKPHYTAIKLEI